MNADTQTTISHICCYNENEPTNQILQNSKTSAQQSNKVFCHYRVRQTLFTEKRLNACCAVQCKVIMNHVTASLWYNVHHVKNQRKRPTGCI